jgi:hypothetical protein
MGKDQLASDRYVLLSEINQISERLKEDRYNEHLNKKLQTLARQVRNLSTAINAY